MKFLADLCNSALTDGEVRRDVRAALVTEKKDDAVDWLTSLTADFHELKKCKQRREVIEQMGKTRDVRFLPLLEEFRPVTTTGKRGKKKVSNPCIGSAVLEAIETITNPPSPDAGVAP